MVRKKVLVVIASLLMVAQVTEGNGTAAGVTVSDWIVFRAFLPALFVVKGQWNLLCAAFATDDASCRQYVTEAVRSTISALVGSGTSATLRVWLGQDNDISILIPGFVTLVSYAYLFPKLFKLKEERHSDSTRQQAVAPQPAVK